MMSLVSGQPSFNVVQYSEFARKNLTQEDAEKRVNLLYEMQGKLQKGEPLSPRSEGEFD